jgi:hypothetical protein
VVEKVSAIVYSACAATALADWCLGESRRKKLKAVIVEWWFYVASISFGQGIRNSSEFFMRAYSMYFRFRQPLMRQVMPLALLLIPGGFVVLCLCIFMPELNRPIKAEVGYDIDSLYPALLLGPATAALSARISWITMRFISRQDGSLQVFVSFLAMAISSVLCAILAFSAIVFANMYEFVVRPLYDDSFERMPDLEYQLHVCAWLQIRADRFVTYAACGVALTPCLLPAAIGAIAQAAFVVGKVFRGVLQPATLFILQRFSESRVGVFSAISVACGVAAKLVTEVARLLF